MKARTRSQRGLAAVTAILIVAVAASAAAVMLAQQATMLDRTSMIAARAQADAYAQAGLDWARGVLLEDRQRAPDVDSLNEGWAPPIAALPVERAIVSGAIVDEQGKFNLNNLVSGSSKRNDADYAAFQHLLSGLGLAPELADAVVDWIDSDQDLAGPGGAENPYYLSLARPYRAADRAMVQVEELYRVRGFDAAAVAKLKPYVTALGSAVPNQPRIALNVNTASERVLAAVLNAPTDTVAQLVARRASRPYAKIGDFTDAAQKAGIATLPVTGTLDVKSAFFSVRVTVAQDDVQLATEALVRRDDQGAATAIIWRRPLY